MKGRNRHRNTVIHTCRSMLRSPLFKTLVTAVLTLLCSAIILFALLPEQNRPTTIRDFVVESGYADTGAPNLVSSIYLGYRLIDTLGETLILLLAVTGAVSLLHKSPDRIDTRNDNPDPNHRQDGAAPPDGVDSH